MGLFDFLKPILKPVGKLLGPLAPIAGGFLGGPLGAAAGGLAAGYAQPQPTAGFAPVSPYGGAAGVLQAPLGGQYYQARDQLAQQMANQQGGMATPGLQGVPTTMTAYTQALQGMLTGQAPQYQAAMTRGIGAIGQQAQLGRQQLGSQLGQRGLLRSGLMGQGLAGIEQGKLSAVGQLTAQLESERMRRQEFGMQQVVAQQQIEQQARQVGISEDQIAQARQTGDYNALVSLIETAAQVIWPPQQPAPVQLPNYNFNFGGLTPTGGQPLSPFTPA